MVKGEGGRQRPPLSPAMPIGAKDVSEITIQVGLICLPSIQVLVNCNSLSIFYHIHQLRHHHRQRRQIRQLRQMRHMFGKLFNRARVGRKTS